MLPRGAIDFAEAPPYCRHIATLAHIAVRTQTLVQLTDELRDLLDHRAELEGVSRSRLIRQMLERALEDDRAAALSRQLVDGYTRVPQSEATDAFGDLEAWTAANARRNLAALAAEEEGRAGW